MKKMLRIASKVDASLGDLVREAREKAGLSQRALADLIDVTGSTIQKYEDGSVKISIETLDAVATATERDLKWFLESAGFLRAEERVTADPALVARALQAAEQAQTDLGRAILELRTQLQAIEAPVGQSEGRAAAQSRSQDIVPEASQDGARRKRGQTRGNSFQNRSRSSSSASEERPDSATS